MRWVFKPTEQVMCRFFLDTERTAFGQSDFDARCDLMSGVTNATWDATWMAASDSVVAATHRLARGTP